MDATGGRKVRSTDMRATALIVVRIVAWAWAIVSINMPVSECPAIFNLPLPCRSLSQGASRSQSCLRLHEDPCYEWKR